MIASKNAVSERDAVTTKTALITGGNRGLGYATARILGASGFLVLVAGRDKDRSEQAVVSLRAEGFTAQALELDVTDERSVSNAARAVARNHSYLDVLVNNAGILPEATALDADHPLDLDLFRRTLDTNVLGAVATTQALLPQLSASPSGRIVNVSSTMGSLADQLDPESPYFPLVLPAYQGSKAALNCLTVVLSKALADSAVKVNAVCPGWVQTDLGGPANRAAAPTTPDEAARVVAQAAMIGPDGPSGTFFDMLGPVPW